MKIVFINSLYAPHEVGGAEKAVRSLAEEAVERGNQAVVISLAPNGIWSIDIINGVKVYYVPMANINFLFSDGTIPKWRKLIGYIVDAYNPIMGLRIKKILKEEKPDIVEMNNLQGISVSSWRAAKSLNIPVVQVLHDYYLGCINSTMYSKEANCKGQCFQCRALCIPRRVLSNIPKAVSSVSKQTLRKLQKTGLFNNVEDFYISSSGINIKKSPQDTLGIHHSAGTQLIVGFLGRLEPIKGISVLCRAILSMPQNTVKLLIAGGGNPEYLLELKREFKSENIHFLGFVKPQDLFKKIHILAVPSVWEEPLSRVIPEAYACGIPVAISRLGGMPEIVEEGLTGYSFEAANPEAIRILLTHLINEDFPTKSQVSACKERISDFDTGEVFERHYRIWEKHLLK